MNLDTMIAYKKILTCLLYILPEDETASLTNKWYAKHFLNLIKKEQKNLIRKWADFRVMRRRYKWQ